MGSSETYEYAGLLDKRVRKALQLYASLGYVGFVISEALAYIALLEEELKARETRMGL